MDRPRPLATIENDLAAALDRLTPRQRAFVEALERVRYHGRYGRAAALAGYAWPDKQGSRLRRMPAVARVLELRLERWRANEARARRHRADRELAWELRLVDLENSARYARLDALIADRTARLTPGAPPALPSGTGKEQGPDGSARSATNHEHHARK